MTVLLGALVAAAVLLTGGTGGRARLRALLPREREARSAGAVTADAESAIGVIAQCASLLRIGATPHSCFEQLAAAHRNAAFGPVLERIARAIELGIAPSAAILQHVRELPAEAARVMEALAAAWHVGDTSGAALGEVLDTLAQCTRDEIDARREREAALAGPKATIGVLSWLPLIGLGLGMLIGADLVSVVTGSPWGSLTILAGSLLLVLGRWWMRRMIRACEEQEGERR